MSKTKPTSLLNKSDCQPIHGEITRREQLIECLGDLLGGSDNVEIWLKSPHPVLGGRTPQSYVDEGKLEVLEYFINAIETGQPS
ncbi:DUF2384 domain-containing protein [Microcoleus sp. FACHB-831]|uniref:MbcA/ParS/Xre antitoxin family protein n=1 Tax=Microcoleus sp. FACHB-831 TaxID=2692827 RepID=UPI00168233A7|nr:MbcA/ParS/Xre antitoxin family protein [Microcoleus sp. FACHB-831]MBD1922068.1 DUF2384 domain-containing protein [Microcoleus sp. FACHB-831]